ncbi:MarR family winged helix-turn-helix transcriptional regulator [Caenimonas terrae]|uniref:MarR family winged helix-turn-helix transcriptional regulator n=1 Tax=Caenimonas terrae TaxID=696074 RepID=A0ABW0NIY0_9BURK
MPSKKTDRQDRLTTSDYAKLAAFRHALRAYVHFSDAAAAEVGLTGPHYQAMLVLRGWQHDAPVTISELARQLFIKHHSAVGLVDRLAAEGLMVREPSSVDRRKVELRLTPRGLELLAMLADKHRDELRRIGPALGGFFGELTGQGGS